jgi:hypothetical protein
MFRFIELPFLNGRLSSDYVIWPIIGTVTGVMGVLAVGIYISAQPSTQATPVVGLNIACDQRGGHYYDLPICRYGTQPTVLLWGDSYAMHLEPGLRAVMGGNGSFVQATKSACSPIMALAYVGGNYSVDWAKDCVAFNRGVTSALAHMSTVRYVLIASSWGQVFTQSAQTLFADGLEQPWSPLAKKHLIKTVRAVQAVGKTAIIVGPTAIADYDVGACNARLESDRLVLGVDSCNPTFKEVDRNLGSIILELREVAMETGATLLLPTEVMCPNGICRSVIRGKSIYHDRGHLTSHGSEYVVRSLGLENMLKE